MLTSNNSEMLFKQLFSRQVFKMRATHLTSKPVFYARIKTAFAYFMLTSLLLSCSTTRTSFYRANNDYDEALTDTLIDWQPTPAQGLPDSSIVKVDSFYSPSVDLQLRFTAVLPAAYYKNKRAYPAIYLLHGHTGNYTSWISYAGLPTQLATRYNCIIILPDAGNSFYINWTGQTDGKPHRWRNMIVADLMPAIEKRYRTITNRMGRAIGGLSMGGFGALSIGLSNPDKFCFVFSSPGAIDFCNYIRDEFKHDTLDWNSPVLWSEDKKVVNSKGFSTWQKRTPPGLVFRKPEDADTFDLYFLLQQGDSALLPFVHIDCGDRDYHLTAALQFAERLKQKGAAYSFFLLPGNHEVPYWKQAVEHTFLIMQQQKFFGTK